MVRFMKRVGRAGLGVLAFAILALGMGVATTLAFPYGGREFHAIFAYWAAGRLVVAVKVYLVYAVALTAGARLLIALRYPLRPITIACIAAVVGAIAWWQIVIWPTQSRSFHFIVMGLFEIMPLLIIGAVFLTMMPRQLAEIARRRRRQ